MLPVCSADRACKSYRRVPRVAISGLHASCRALCAIIAIMSCPWPTADWQPVCDLWHPDGVLNAHDGLRASSSGPTCTAIADTRLELAPAVPVAACISSSALLAQQLHMTAPLFAIMARLLLFLACRATSPGSYPDAVLLACQQPPEPSGSPGSPQWMHLPSRVCPRRARGHTRGTSRRPRGRLKFSAVSWRAPLQ